MLALEEYANIQERYLLIKTNFNDGKKRSAAIIYQKILSGGKISYLINTTVRKIVVDLVFFPTDGYNVFFWKLSLSSLVEG